MSGYHHVEITPHFEIEVYYGLPPCCSPLHMFDIESQSSDEYIYYLPKARGGGPCVSWRPLASRSANDPHYIAMKNNALLRRHGRPYGAGRGSVEMNEVSSVIWSVYAFERVIEPAFCG